jgi:geranylgeranyl pyrophosphate synthase
LADHFQRRPFAAARLHEASRYSLLAPGKRLRPILCLWGHDALRPERSELVVDAALALEMVHTYSLVHDDLPAMDDDDLRRGQPTCHVQFDPATAILAGDALLTEAFFVLTEHATDSAQCVGLVRRLADAAGGRGMVAGQQRDLAAAGEPSLDAMLEIHRLKTGRLLGAALALGAACAGLDAEGADRVDAAGQRLGVAFQIVDDVLDARGTTEQLGKSAGKDQAQDKLTAVATLGVQAAQARAGELLEESLSALAAVGVTSPRLTGLAHALVRRDR